MKKILIALAAVAVGVALAVFVLRSRTQTVVVERDVDAVPVIEISGVLDQAGARKIVRALRRAESKRPDMVVISFDSPGGDVAGSLAVADVISGLSVPTAGLVRDGVGGTVFMIAAVDQIYFSPNGVCGAASFGEPLGASDALQKIQSYFRSKVTTYAEANGHAADVFLALTDQSAELVRDTKVWKRRGEMMTLTGKEALAIGLSVGTVASPEEIIAKQKKTEANQALQTTSVTRSGFGKVPVSDRQRRVV